MNPSVNNWALYEASSSFVLGFHGCKKSVAKNLISGKSPKFQESKNGHDWLGPGMYFWENSPERALQWAIERHGANNAAIVGAIIDLRFCLNLFDYAALATLKEAFNVLKAAYETLGESLPVNTGGPDKGKRTLDDEVFRALDQYREDNELPKYDSIRGLFVEGKELYPGAGFREKDHIQICIRNAHCIKGYFNPIAI